MYYVVVQTGAINLALFSAHRLDDHVLHWRRRPSVFKLRNTLLRVLRHLLRIELSEVFLDAIGITELSDYNEVEALVQRSVLYRKRGIRHGTH